MPQPLMLKKLKLNRSMKTYKIFCNTKKRCPFYRRGLECKSRKSRDTWSNRQVWPWRTKWNKATSWILPRECMVTANTLFQQHNRWFYTWTSLNGQHWNQIGFILCSWRWRNCVESVKTRPETDCSSDHQSLITKFRLKLKKAKKLLSQPSMT